MTLQYEHVPGMYYDGRQIALKAENNGVHINGLLVMSNAAKDRS